MRLIRLFKHDLRAEAVEWVENGLIDPAQAEKICAHYGLDYSANSSSFGYRVLIALGYLFIGLALIVLIGGNWDEIPRALRMGALIALTVALQAVGVRAYLNHKPEAACGFFFLGNLMYGASIILIAQIYHLGEHMPDGVYWWALGCLPFALLMRSRWLMILSLSLAALWFYLETVFAYSTWSLGVFLAGAIYVLLRGEQSIILMLATAVLAGVYVETSVLFALNAYAERQLLTAVMPMSIALGLLYWALSQWFTCHPNKVLKSYGVVLELWSLRLGVLLLFLGSFEDVWHEIMFDLRLPPLALAVCAVSLGLAALLGIRAKRTSTIISALTVSVLLFLIAALWQSDSLAFYLQIVINILAIVVGVRLIIRGLDTGRSQLYFLGIFTILGIGLLRYVDLIGNYIGGALVFAFFAAVLLISAKYWKRQQSSESEGDRP